VAASLDPDPVLVRGGELVNRHSKGDSSARRRAGLKASLAAGILLTLGVGLTAAAYFDESTVNFSVGGSFDIAYLDGLGTVHQGDPNVYEIDSTGLEPISQQGDDSTQVLELRVKNVGTADSGAVQIRVQSLLPTQVADADGIIRDPFNVLLMTVAVDSDTVLTEVAATSVVIPLSNLRADEDRTISITLWYSTGLNTPFYSGKDVKLGFTMTGVCS
jgi:hypothetical protein